MAKIEKLYQQRSVKSLIKMGDKLKFDIPIQRNKGVWNPIKKSKLIHSILYGYPIPACYAKSTEDKDLLMLDGKQRLTTVLDYVNNEFALIDNIPDIEGVKIAGKKFEELPEELQDEIKDHEFSIYYLKNISDEEVENCFLNFQEGVPLSNIEKNRVVAGSNVMKFIQELSNQSFFKESINVSQPQRNRFVDEEIILQIIGLILNNGEGIDLSGKSIRDLSEALNKHGIPEDVKTTLIKTTDYLAEAFPKSEKYLKKTHVPIIFIQAIIAITDKVKPSQFAGWIKAFFDNRYEGSVYEDNSKTGTAKKEAVVNRLTELKFDYNDNIHLAPEYIPVIKDKDNGQQTEINNVIQLAINQDNSDNNTLQTMVN